MKSRFVLICSLLTVLLLTGSTAARNSLLLNVLEQEKTTTSQVKPEGSWEGTLDVSVAKLRLVLHVTSKDGQLSATLDSPDQGATGLPVNTISVTGDTLSFEMNTLGAAYQGKFTKDGSQIDGEFSQQGQRFPLTFKRVGQSAAAENILNLQKVDIGGRSLNLLIGGKGSPAVVFEGGFGAGIASWSTVQKDVAAFAQTVSYDRAGLGQSEVGPKPRSAKQIALELHTALEKAGVKPPYVLVGHSLGGVYVRVFADLYPKEAAGLVLIDPSQEAFDEWIKKNAADQRKEQEGRIAQAPEGVRAEWQELDATYAEARASKVPKGIPVTLISATRDEGPMPPEAKKMWVEKQKEWLATVPGSKHIITDKSGHFVQAEQPAMVVEAIRGMVKQVH